MKNIKLLKSLGLTEYESKAYLALAKLGPSTAREIHVKSHLPRNKTYEALESLEAKNKITSLPLSPKQFKITDPENFLEELKEKQVQTKSLIKQIKSSQPKEIKDMFTIIKGQKQIHEKLSLNNQKLKSELLGCFNLSKMRYKNFQTLSKAIKRGVNVKFICKFEEKHKEVYSQYLKIGVKIKVFNEKLFGPLLPRMAVLDKKIGTQIIGSPEIRLKEDYTMFWIESKSFAEMQRKHFKNMWKNSIPINNLLKNN